MNGIAIIIWLDQLKKIFAFGGIKAFSGPLWENLFIVVATIILAFALPALFKKHIPKYASLLSGTFLAIIIMTLVANVFHLAIEHVHVVGSLHSFNDAFLIVKSQWPTNWSSAVLLAAIPFAVQLAILAYLDTLLTSLVIDKMTKEKTKQNKELIAQGVANGVVGFLGGIPGAQATIRSVLIVKEKADSRLAGILVGVFALIEMIIFQDSINLIPQAVFSGILFKVGYDVFDWKPLRLYIKEWFRDRYDMIHAFFSQHNDEPIFVSNTEFFMIVGTSVATIVWNLNVAVIVFTVLFYLANKLLFRKNPMRDLLPIIETEGMADES